MLSPSEVVLEFFACFDRGDLVRAGQLVADDALITLFVLRGVMAAPPLVRAARAVGEGVVRDRLTEVFRAFETPTGSYALKEEVRYLIARR